MLQEIVTVPAKTRPRYRQYHVVLWNDEDHTYDYVIRMLRSLFGHTREKAYRLATEVDLHGKAICLTTTREHAELKQEQIHAYGRDRRVHQCKGSMSATVEPQA